MEQNQKAPESPVQILESIIRVQKNNLKEQLKDYQQSEEKWRYDSEELECVNMFLDDMKVPTHDTEIGSKYSTVGRIKVLMEMIQNQ
jgi:hypothetical protein